MSLYTECFFFHAVDLYCADSLSTLNVMHTVCVFFWFVLALELHGHVFGVRRSLD